MKIPSGFKKVLLGMAMLMFGMATHASAASYTLGLPNFEISGYPAPYATVGVVLNGSTKATITFTGLIHDGYTYKFGDGSSGALNVNASNFSATDFNTPAGVFKQANYFPVPSVDGFGNFNLTIDFNDGAAKAQNAFRFTLTNLSGTWANEADVLKLNADGHFLAAHIFAFYGTETNARATGYATVSSVPEPGTLVLLGSGLLGLAVVGARRKFRK